MQKNSFIFDYDSTLISLESFDQLLFKSLGDDEEKKQIVEDLTNAGMAGVMDLKESLQKRLDVAQISEEHLTEFKGESIKYISDGKVALIEFLQKNNQEIFILSGGFRELIFPVADFLNIPRENCFANEFIKQDGFVKSINFNNPLTQSDGKTQVIRQGKDSGFMSGKVFCIGDGMSDAKPFIDGVADDFLGFGQNIVRPTVQEKAQNFFLKTSDLQQYIEINIL